MRPDDELLFQRFCQHGDVQALGELFDRTAPALLRVALHVCRDPAAAEDLVQGTFLRAIEVRAQWDAQRPVLPWLCGLLHNRARHDRWQRGRTPDPQRLVTPAPVDPARLAERSEFDAAVDAAIAGLPEPYRPVLRLHLAYGHEPAAIAHALERPPGTVRSQLARGLELLRNVLPAGFAGGAALLLASGRGLAAIKQVIVAHGVMVAVAPAVAVGSLLGGLAMMKKLVVVGVMVGITVGAWFVARQPEAAPLSAVPGARVAAAEHSGLPGASPSAANAQDITAAIPRTMAPVSDVPTTGTLRIRCTYEADGAPAWDVGVVVSPVSVRDRGMHERTVRPDASGQVTVADVPIGQTNVTSDRGGAAALAVEGGKTHDVNLVIPTGVHVRGRVVDEQGTAIAGARIWLSVRVRSVVDGDFVATSDEAGQFSLRAVEPGRFLSASACGRRSAVVQPVVGEKGAAVGVQLVLPGTGASLLGSVLGPDGAPAADARVLVGSLEQHLAWDARTHAEHRPPGQTRTAADGSFVVNGLEHGSKQAVWVRANGSCVWRQLVTLEREGDTSLAVRLQRGGTLTGRVTSGDGKSAAGAWVDYRSSAWHPIKAEFWEQREPSWAHYAVQADGDGNYRIDGITPGTLVLRASHEGCEVRGEVALADGAAATWNPVLVEIALRGRVVDQRGEGMAGIEVTAMPPRGMGAMNSDTTNAEGRFIVRRLSQVPHVITFALANDRVRARHLTTRFGVSPGPEELLVQLTDAMLPTATIVGRLLDVDGRVPVDAEVRAASVGMAHDPAVRIDATTGTFRLGPLPAGTWRVQGQVGEFPEQRRAAWGEPFVLAAGEVHDVGTLQMPATGSIDVTAADAQGKPIDGVMLVLEESTGWSEQPWGVGMLERGKRRIDHVAPGAYRLRLGGERGLPTVHRPVVVVAGQQLEVSIVVSVGVAVDLVMGRPSEPVPIHEHFEWRRDGEFFQRYDNWRERGDEVTWRTSMQPGSWEVTITSETGKVATTRFVLAVGDPAGRRIDVRMP